MLTEVFLYFLYAFLVSISLLGYGKVISLVENRFFVTKYQNTLDEQFFQSLIILIPFSIIAMEQGGVFP